MLTFLKRKIENSPGQMITYAEYIETALYHPTFGYYIKPKEKIGKKGDFLTTSSYSDIYGQMVAKWFIKMIEKYSLPPIFCEIGGGTGKFAKSFIEEWQRQREDKLQYMIVDSSPYHQQLQKEALSFYGKVKFFPSIDEVETFSGVIFSNELFDALPVHVVEKKNGQVMEVMITIKNNELTELFVPLKNREIHNFLKQSDISLKEGQRIEIPLAMEKVLQQMSQVLHEGFALTVDYGYDDEEWMEDIHRKGSLRGYYQHQMIENVLLYPGEMDITTHIHFDSLIRIGKRYDLHFIEKMRQDEFLIANGILDELQAHYDPNPFSEVSKRNRQIRNLILPNSISQYFHVILQGKGFE